jgi:hypothetical protein
MLLGDPPINFKVLAFSPRFISNANPMQEKIALTIALLALAGAASAQNRAADSS